MATPATPLRSGSMWPLPPATRVMVRERRKRLCALAEGRVLDLAGSRPSAFKRADEVVHGLDEADARDGAFDTVVSVLLLSGAPDHEELISRIGRALAPGGRLVFLEPVREPGLGRIGQGVVSPVLQRAAGWRVDRDIPALLRDAGWAITDLERIDMPRYLWPLHAFVEGRARPRLAPEAGDASGDTASGDTASDDPASGDTATGATGSGGTP